MDLKDDILIFLLATLPALFVFCKTLQIPENNQGTIIRKPYRHVTMDGDRKGEGKSGRGGFLVFLHRNSKQQAVQIGQGIGGFGTKEGDGAGEHFRVSSSPQMHLNADWFHACRPRQARTHFHQLTASIRKPLSLPCSFFFSTSLAFTESHQAAHVGFTPAFSPELLLHGKNAFSACPISPH